MARIFWRNAARRGGEAWGGVVVADAHKLPLRYSCSDLLPSTGTLHHIRRPADVFRECARVLEGRGEAWMYEFSHDAPRAEVGRMAREFKRPILCLKLVAAQALP
ncbi:MAG: methyltransferase domain-containing protein [Thermoproteales archaeon]|nr:methyltransferase domain-containing protein [Thermoproteales archaeon]